MKNFLAYVMIVADKNHFLNGPDVISQELHPVMVQIDLFHVYVTGWHIFVAISQPWVLISFLKVYHNQIDFSVLVENDSKVCGRYFFRFEWYLHYSNHVHKIFWIVDLPYWNHRTIDHTTRKYLQTPWWTFSRRLGTKKHPDRAEKYIIIIID